MPPWFAVGNYEGGFAMAAVGDGYHEAFGARIVAGRGLGTRALSSETGMARASRLVASYGVLRLPSRLIPHRHRSRAELQPAYELQVDTLR